MAIQSIPHRPHRIGNWPRLWFGLSGGFSDQCCASTTLSIFHAGMKGRARIQPRRERTLAFAHGLWGDLDGRNLASALMRSRVHNRTCDRGCKLIRLALRAPLPWQLAQRLLRNGYDVVFTAINIYSPCTDCPVK